MSHEYKIVINNGCSMKNPFKYQYGGVKNPIELYVRKDNAVIRLVMGKKKTHEELRWFKVLSLKDAFRKVFLLHGLLYDQNIKVHKITMVIDGDEEIYDKTAEGFPFVYSMISKTPMNLPSSWKSRELCQRMIEKSRTEADKDRAQIAVFALLSSKGREYVIDQFSNLWTAMNAYYQYVGELYNVPIREKYHFTNALQKQYSKELTKYVNDNRIASRLMLAEDDAPCMSLLMKCIGKSKEKLSRYAFAAPKNFKNRNSRFSFERELAKVPMDRMPELYKYALEIINGTRKAKQNDEFWELNKLSKEMEQELYYFLVFEIPYYCRCRYLHGAKATLLLSYAEEYDIKVLRRAGYCVESFLLDRIPEIVNDEYQIPERVMKEREARIFNHDNRDYSRTFLKMVNEELGLPIPPEPSSN